MSQLSKMFTSSNNFNNNKTDKILQNIDGLFPTKNIGYQNNNSPNPFNIGNSKIHNNNHFYINYAYNMNNTKNQKELFCSDKNPINNLINFPNDNINDNNNINLNTNNELVNNNIFSINNIGVGQSPIFINESNSNIFGRNSNEDYNLYTQIVENNKNSLDIEFLKNYQNKISNNNNIEINKNLNLNNQAFNSNNNNYNIISPDNKNNLNFINQNIKKEEIIPINKFNFFNNSIKIETEKKSISEDIRNHFEKININEISPEWFKNENNYNDPLYFDKLKNFELEKMGIKPLKLSDFLIGRKLGSGQFGRVYLVKYKPTQVICALKIINKNKLLKEGINCINQVRREIEIQSHLHHKNILSLYNFFWDKKNVYLVMEYCPGGELYKVLTKQKDGRFLEPQAAFYINQVCDALEYIQRLHIIHRDIKPENILLSNDIIKLADFGWSIHQKSNKLRTTFCGTAEYMPPEVLEHKPHIPSSDLWCLGILIYELCTGGTPFVDKSNNKIFQRIKTLNMKKYPNYFSKEVKDLIGKLIQKSPGNRISIKEVKNHPWIVENIKKYCNN